MIFLNKEDAIKLNQICLNDGESHNVLDMNRLESALGNQYAPYEHDEQAIASTYKSLVLNHAFENGNKRTALLAMLYLTSCNNKELKINEDELIDLTMKIANEGGSQISVNHIANVLFGLELEEDLSFEAQKEKLNPADIISHEEQEALAKGVVTYDENGNVVQEDIEKHEELNQILFDKDELKPEIKDAIQKIADTFVDEIKEDDVNLVLKDVVLVGSNVNYNYTKDSDLDIHLIVDSKALDCPQEIVDKLYGAYRTIFNKNYDISIKGIPAEIYVELDEPKGISNGVYSLNTGWIKKPVQQDVPEIDRDAFNALFNEYEEQYINMMSKL